MRKGKIFLSVVALLFAALFLCAYSETREGLRYTLDEAGNAVIVGYAGLQSTLTIPAEIDGHPVTAVGKTAFFRDAYLRKVTVSAGIPTLEADSFAYCENLHTVILEGGEGIEVLERAFEGCANLTKLELGEGVTLLDDFSFRGCYRLGEVTLPASLKTIGHQAFGDCESLRFRTENCPAGQAYAAENGVDVSYRESSEYLFLKLAIGTGIGLLAVAAAAALWKRRKKRAKKAGS